MVCANRPLRKPRTVRRHTLINRVVVHKGQRRPYFCNLVNFASAMAWDLITHHPRSSALGHSLLGTREQAVVRPGSWCPWRNLDTSTYRSFKFFWHESRSCFYNRDKRRDHTADPKKCNSDAGELQGEPLKRASDLPRNDGILTVIFMLMKRADQPRRIDSQTDATSNFHPAMATSFGSLIFAFFDDGGELCPYATVPAIPRAMGFE